MTRSSRDPPTGQRTAPPLPAAAGPSGPSDRHRPVRGSTGPMGRGQGPTPAGWRPRPSPPAPGRDRSRGQADRPTRTPLICLSSTLAKTHPSVLRRTRGVGTPAAWAASWNMVANRTSSSPDWRNGAFTAQLPSAVSSRHSRPCFPRGDRPIRQPRGTAESEASSEVPGVHRATPAHLERDKTRRRNRLVDRGAGCFTGAVEPGRPWFAGCLGCPSQATTGRAAGCPRPGLDASWVAPSGPWGG